MQHKARRLRRSQHPVFRPYGGSLAVPTTDAKNVYAATCSIDETASTIYRILRKPFQASCAGEVFAFDKAPEGRCGA